MQKWNQNNYSVNNLMCSVPCMLICVYLCLCIYHLLIDDFQLWIIHEALLVSITVVGSCLLCRTWPRYWTILSQLKALLCKLLIFSHWLTFTKLYLKQPVSVMVPKDTWMGNLYRKGVARMWSSCYGFWKNECGLCEGIFRGIENSHGGNSAKTILFLMNMR